MSFGAIGGSIAGSLVSGLMGSGGGSGGAQTVTNVPWEGYQPYLVGNSSYNPVQQNPINSDWLWWNYQMAQGNMVGPPPPMFVNDPRYTGENVYDPPFQYQNARLTGPSYGDTGPHGASINDTSGAQSGMNPPGSDYPSGGRGNTILEPPAQDDQPQQSQGISDAELAQQFMRFYNLNNGMYDGGHQIDALTALRWAQQNQGANPLQAGFDVTGQTAAQLLDAGGWG